jgi:peptidoglycan hydrolase-like protein with peptidoglycan-binding domain
VDARPIVALAAPIPLFRDLRLGDEGEDVSALRQALRYLGFDVDAAGSYNQAVANAVKQLQRTTGI